MDKIIDEDETHIKFIENTGIHSLIYNFVYFEKDILIWFDSFFDEFEIIPENFSGIYILKNILKVFFKNGIYHNSKHPAIIFNTEYDESLKIFCINGHISNSKGKGPAIITKSPEYDTEHYFVDGKRHRYEFDNGKLLPSYVSTYPHYNPVYYIDGEEISEEKVEKINTFALIDNCNFNKDALNETFFEFSQFDKKYINEVICRYENVPENFIADVNAKDIINFYKSTKAYKLSRIGLILSRKI